MERVSIRQTLIDAFRFLTRRAGEYVPRILISSLAGGLIFYWSLYLYLVELEMYLTHPTEQVASVVLGVATAGLLMTLYAHAVTATAIASLALGCEEHGWKYFAVSRRTWRVYAAHLRFLLAGAVFLAIMKLAATGFAALGVDVILIKDIAIAAGLFLLAAGAGFLITPVAVAHDKGQVVRQSWKLSQRDFARIAVIVLAVLLIGFLVESTGEMIIRATGQVPPMAVHRTLADAVASFRSMLPLIMVAIGVAYVIGFVLLTAAAASAYRQITGFSGTPES